MSEFSDRIIDLLRACQMGSLRVTLRRASERPQAM